jgi:hypothetical protein
MRALIATLFLVAAIPAFAQDAPPTDESLRELIDLSGAAKLLDQARPQLEAMMEQVFQEALEDKSFTPDQEQILSDMRDELLALVLEDFSWARYEPKFMEIYRRSFSQAEVEGMIAFYRSDVGQALLAKMPLVMQNTMELMKDNLAGLMPKIEAIKQRAFERLRALEPAKG